MPEGKLTGRKRLIQRLTQRADKVVQRTTVLTLDRLLQLSPEESGRLKANYRVGISHPDRSVTWHAEEGDIQRARQRALRVVKQIRAGDVVFVTNNAPHARLVPKQARFVRRC